MNRFYFTSFHSLPTPKATALFFLMLILDFFKLDAQTPTVFFEDWVQSGGSGPTQAQNELLEKIATTVDGSSNLFVASTTFNGTSDVYDLLLQKFSSGGTLIWSTQYNITSGGNVLVGDLILDSGGNPIFTGAVDNGANSYDALTAKFSTSGSVTWHNTWNGAADGYDGGTSVVVDGSDNVYITGVSTASSVSRDFLTIKYTSGGTETWVSEYDHAGFVDIGSKLSYGSGFVRCLGAVQVDGGEWAMGRIVYDASTGVATGSASIISSSVVFNEINGFTNVNDYTYVVGAVDNGADGYDYLAVVVDPAMDVAWTATWDGTGGKDVAKAVAVDGSGNVYVTGYTTTATHGRDYATLKYNSSGTLQWAETYDGARHGNDQGSDVEVDGNGDIFVTGFAVEDGDEDYVTFWYDGSGTELWHGNFNSIYNRKDKAVDLELDGDGNIFVTGRTVKVDAEMDATVETTTVKYRKTDLLIPPDEEEISSAIYFIKNNGQLLDTDFDPVPDIRFYSEDSYPSLYLFDDHLSMVVWDIDADTTTVDTTHRVDIKFFNKGSNTAVSAMGQRDDFFNYYLGHIPEGRERVPLNQRAVHTNAFDGIDIQYTSNTAGLKYDFIVKPGADPDDIKLVFDGQASLSVNGNGELVIGTSIGDLALPAPLAYEIEDNEEEELGGTWEYAVSGDTVSFITGAYDHDLPLIIKIKKDPERETCEEVDATGILYSTYYGGVKPEEAHDMASMYRPTPGSDFGTIYITGEVTSSDFPVLGDGVLNLQGNKSAFVVSMNNYLRNWTTYYGGNKDQNGVKGLGATRGLAIMPFNNQTVWFGGGSNCADLPRTESSTDPDVFIGTLPSAPVQVEKGFLVSLKNSNGLRTYGTFFGGTVNSRVYSLDVNSEGHVFIGGISFGGLSSAELDDGNTANYTDPGSDGQSFIAEFDLANHLVWSTEFAHPSSALVDLDVDYNDDLLVTGIVDYHPSDIDYKDQPGISDLYIDDTNNPYNGFNTNVYIGKFTKVDDEWDLIWCTLFPGNADECPQEIRANPDNEIYLVGTTTSTTFQSLIQSTVSNSNSGSTDLFIAKFSSQGLLELTRFLGGGEQEGSLGGFTVGAEPLTTGMTMDAEGNIFIASFTNSINLDLVPGPYDQEHLSNSAVTASSDNGDVLVAALSSHLEDRWITYFGGQSTGDFDKMYEAGNGIEVSLGGKLYMTGSTTSECNDNRIPLKHVTGQGSSYYYFDHLNKDASPVDKTISDSYITVFDLNLLDEVNKANEKINGMGLKTFPSPVDEILTVVVPAMNRPTEVAIYDVFGRQMYSFKTGSGQERNLQVSTSSLPNGFYIITMGTEEGGFISEKIIVQHG